MRSTAQGPGICTFIVVAICLCVNTVKAQSPNDQPRPRIVVTADPELDDNNSLIRFLSSQGLSQMTLRVWTYKSKL